MLYLKVNLFSELYPFLYGKSKELDLMIHRLQDTLELEIQTQRDLRQILGTMDVLLTASEFNSNFDASDQLETAKPLGRIVSSQKQ